MIRQLLMGAALALATVAGTDPPLFAATAPHHRRTSQWQWSDTQVGSLPLVVRLVRGSARIVRREGPAAMTIEATSATGNPDAVTFAVERTPGSVTIEDRYGRPPVATWRECLPPSGERGDFWTSDVVMNAVIYAPAHLPVRVEIMDPRPSSAAAASAAVRNRASVHPD